MDRVISLVIAPRFLIDAPLAAAGGSNDYRSNASGSTPKRRGWTHSSSA
jgi:hypothetical protein